ncbi:MAG: hypothetical protein KME28_27195 [Pelatocladus maniniholoensis HA4357-MV3]|jgi:hypothetical protein|uniref:Uncharacterized protein n=1 Tax=Pelatocladus maniniholoensis HA4357-MV3 TaxID=1117104 RepID=A0A9E3HDS3_9NOST|nr:hypothetical protein [Pelatocladus maniniholoensis HA4357-MV3]
MKKQNIYQESNKQFTSLEHLIYLDLVKLLLAWNNCFGLEAYCYQIRF